MHNILKGVADELPEDLFDEKFDQLAEEDMDAVDRQLQELSDTGKFWPGSAVHHMWQKACKSPELKQEIEMAGRGHEVGPELKRKWASTVLKARVQKKAAT